MANKTLSITIPVDHWDAIVDAIAYNHQYQDTVDGEANPTPKAKYAKDMTIAWIKDNVTRYRRRRTKEEQEALEQEISGINLS